MNRVLTDGGSDEIRVLHVDDDPRLLELSELFLQRESDRFDVETATAVDDALARLDEDAIDCVVSDYDMPGATGIEFLETVRDRFPELPFILFTGKGSEEVAGEAISAGVTDYLQKERATEQYAILANRILNAVERTRARRELATSERQLREIYERITDGFFAVNTDWEYVYVNEEGARLVDLEPEDIRGRTVWEVFPEIEETPFAEALRTAMTSQERTRIEEYYPPTERWYAVTIYPDPTGISIFFNDVTERRTNERELEAERNRRAALFENLGEPIVEVSFADDRPIIEGFNEAFGEVFGLEESTVVGDPLDGHIVPDDEQSDAREINRRVREGELAELEVRRETADGHRWFLLRPAPYRLDDEARGYAMYIDVTERVVSTSELESIVGNLPGYVYRHRYEPGYPLEFVRGDVASVTGYTPEELESEVTAAEEIIHPDDRAGLWDDLIAEVEETGRFDVTYRIVTKDEAVRWVRDQGQLIEEPLTGEAVLDGFVIDVTERVEHERALEQQRAFVDEALDALQDVFYALDEDGELVRWNERVPEVSGYTDADIEAMDTLEMFAEEHHERLLESITETLETGSSTVRADVLTAEGERIPYEFRGTRLDEPNPEGIRVVGVGRDVSGDGDGA